MMSKEKFQIEFSIKSTEKLLFNRLSTAGGLHEWFAENVKVNGKVFTFEWDGTEQEAEMIHKKDLKFVRFHWLDDEDEKSYFEFKINMDELTGELALIVTDFAESDEVEDAKELWESQITELKHVLGS